MYPHFPFSLCFHLVQLILLAFSSSSSFFLLIHYTIQGKMPPRKKRLHREKKGEWVIERVRKRDREEKYSVWKLKFASLSLFSSSYSSRYTPFDLIHITWRETKLWIGFSYSFFVHMSRLRIQSSRSIIHTKDQKQRERYDSHRMRLDWSIHH